MSKILVICFSSINNVAMAIPVIHSLATQYAQHQIMVLSIDTFSPLFENVPDNVIFRGADFRGEHAGLMGLGWLYNDLKEEKFDAVAAFQPTFRSRFLCWRFRLAGIKAAHIKQNRRELQKLIRRKHKIYTEQDSFFQRCAHTLSQIGYPIRLSFLSLFGKNKGNISSLAPLTGEKNQETWIGIAPFATHVGKIYPLSKQEQILKHLSARDHTKIFLFGGGKKEIKVLEEWAQHDIMQKRLDKALELGATGVINSKEEDVLETMAKLTNGKGIDLVIETAGMEITTRQAIHVTKKGATIVLVGYSKSGEMTLPLSLALDKELTFKTVFRYRHIYPMAIEAVASGKVNLKGIVTNVFDFGDIQHAMDSSVQDKANIVKSVVKF